MARPALALPNSSVPILFLWTSSYRSWTVTKRRAASRPTLRYAQSRLSRLRLMRSAAKDRRRERPAAMITFRSPSAHVSYWRRLSNTCPKLGHLNFDAELLLLGEQALAYVVYFEDELGRRSAAKLLQDGLGSAHSYPSALF